jgi:IPT/TIG domain
MSDTVVIRSGEVLRFPVSSDDPLAKYQHQLDVSQVSNLHDLATVRTITRTNPRLSTDQIIATVKGILASSGVSTILNLTLPDLIVEEGATMVCGGPITTISAGNVIVLGEILVYGDLNLSCSTLGDIAPPVISSISPSTGSTLGGTVVGIQGTGFSSVSAVYFGSTPATSFERQSDVFVVATAPPANAGPVDMTLLAFGALSSSTSAADVFTYVYLPGVVSINVSSNFLWTGESSTGTIILNEPAPSAGTTVTLGISGPTGVTVPADIIVRAGDTSASFLITAAASATAGAATITATGPDGAAQSATIEVYSGQVFLLLNLQQGTGPGGTVEYLLRGHTASGSIVVRTSVPASGGLVGLTTNRPDAVAVPANVPLVPGSTSANFNVTALASAPVIGPEQSVSVTVSATYEGESFTFGPFPVYAQFPPPTVPVPRPGPTEPRPI